MSAEVGQFCIKFLADAVLCKKPLEIHYKDAQRIVCPFLLAKTKDDRYVLHALQIGGMSSKGPVTEPVWRFLYLDEIVTYGLANAAWVQPEFLLSKAEYTPPKFITEIIAVHPKEQ